MKIAIAGTGYVGLSNAILLSQHHKVTAVDVIQEKVDMSTGRNPRLSTITSKTTWRTRISTSPPPWMATARTGTQT